MLAERVRTLIDQNQFGTLLRLAGQPDAPMAEAANRYALAGAKVFPLHWISDTLGGKACSCGRGAECVSPGKHPLTRHGLTEATDDRDTVRRWWERWPNANVGLPAGNNGLAVLDNDPKSGGDESYNKLDAWCSAQGVTLHGTLCARTGSGGMHHYFAEPAGGIKSDSRAFGTRRSPGLDTRGRGGYVVAPPSVGLLGRYEFLAGVDTLQPWPGILSDLMALKSAAPDLAPAVPYVPSTTTRKGWGAAALTGECGAVAALGPLPRGSGRNARLNAAAYKLGRIVGGGHLDEGEVRAELLNAARAANIDGGERVALATIESGLRAGMARPRGPAPATVPTAAQP